MLFFRLDSTQVALHFFFSFWKDSRVPISLFFIVILIATIIVFFFFFFPYSVTGCRKADIMRDLEL